MKDDKQLNGSKPTNWAFPLVDHTVVSSHDSLPPYGSSATSMAGTVAAGGTSPSTPSSYGTWPKKCVALLPISSELCPAAKDKQVPEFIKKRTHTHWKKGRETEQEFLPPRGRQLPRYKVPSFLWVRNNSQKATRTVSETYSEVLMDEIRIWDFLTSTKGLEEAQQQSAVLTSRRAWLPNPAAQGK